MITRSDNTATDMIFKVAGVDNIRRFIASAGLANTLVPDSTRAFTGYLFGADDYRDAHVGAIVGARRGPASCVRS